MDIHAVKPDFKNFPFKTGCSKSAVDHFTSKRPFLMTAWASCCMFHSRPVNLSQMIIASQPMIQVADKPWGLLTTACRVFDPEEGDKRPGRRAWRLSHWLLDIHCRTLVGGAACLIVRIATRETLRLEEKGG